MKECTAPGDMCRNLFIACGDCEYYKEDDMKDEYAKARVKDIKKAHEDGCDDVKGVLENMYPDVFKKEYCCDWMREMVKCDVFKDHGCNDSFRFSINDIRDKNYNNVIYFCPRCGKKL